MKINRNYRIGFYDHDGIFFEMFDNTNPEKTYSYACANGLSYHVIRISNPNGPYNEHRITPKTAKYLVNLQ